jgi:hypothetical protein
MKIYLEQPNVGYQDEAGNPVCACCGTHFVIGLDAAKELQKTFTTMRKALKALMQGQEIDDKTPDVPIRVVVRACPSEEAILLGYKALGKAEGKER